MKTIRYDFYFILKCFANFIIQGRIYIFQMFTNKNSVLKNRNFMLLLFGKIVSQLGNWVYYLAIIYFITQVTKSTASTGIILFFNAVPVIMFGAIAGSVCKRYSKKFILVFSDYISGFLSLYLGVKALTVDLSLIEASIITFLLGVSKSFFTPALLSAIPTIVDESELNRANSLIKSTNSVTNILGPLIGGTMIMLIGCPIAFILNGISFIISAISEMFIEIPNSNNKNEKLRWYKNIAADFVEGMNFVKSNRLIYNILIVFSIMTFFASPMVLIFHQLVDKYYNMSSIALSIIMIADSVGVLISGVYLIFNPKIRHQREFIYIFPLFCGIALIVIGNIINFYITVIVMFIQGFVSGFGEISMMTIFQAEIPDKQRGMVFSLYSMIMNALAPISLFISGFVIQAVPISIILSICGVILVLGSIWMCYQFVFKKRCEHDTGKIM